MYSGPAVGKSWRDRKEGSVTSNREGKDGKVRRALQTTVKGLRLEYGSYCEGFQTGERT